MLISIIAGARPNFMKIAPVIRAIHAARGAGHEIEYRLVHTGQHFDKKMSEDLFQQLNLPEPHVNLGAGGGTQAEQTAAIMISFEKDLIDNRPDLVLVVGDVTSTLACAITAKKICVPVVHVEAGIRSGDMTMPEEINRIVTDSICDHFFTTSQFANDLLRKNGVENERIHFVGNTMIDSLMYNMEFLREPAFWNELGLEDRKYFLLTLHRPANVDDAGTLTGFLDAIVDDTEPYKVIFPVHPRTQKTLQSICYSHPRIVQIDPLGYLEFVYLLKNTAAVITDSGGITEEATVLNIPCLTLRNSTERPETISLGTNELVGTDPSNLTNYLRKVIDGRWKSGRIPDLWDGRSAERIVEVLLEIYSSGGNSHRSKHVKH